MVSFDLCLFRSFYFLLQTGQLFSDPIIGEPKTNFHSVVSLLREINETMSPWPDYDKFIVYQSVCSTYNRDFPEPNLLLQLPFATFSRIFLASCKFWPVNLPLRSTGKTDVLDVVCRMWPSDLFPRLPSFYWGLYLRPSLCFGHYTIYFSWKRQDRYPAHLWSSFSSSSSCLFSY